MSKIDESNIHITYYRLLVISRDLKTHLTNNNNNINKITLGGKIGAMVA